MKINFKIEAKRGDKQYPITSPEICSKLGEALLKRFLDLRVDVHNPEKRITLEGFIDFHLYFSKIHNI